MKIRIKFRKYGLMKFVGHLDLMRFFQKAIRRCGIDICYTKGFSPHQIMSFAAPLGLGLTSDGEYLDIEVHASASSEASIAALNREMVEGMEITGYVQLDDKAKPATGISFRHSGTAGAVFLSAGLLSGCKLRKYGQSETGTGTGSVL